MSKEQLFSEVLTTALIDRIIKVQEEKGLTQRLIAENSGLTQGQVSRILNYKSIPTLSTIEALCVGVNIDFKLTLLDLTSKEDV